MKRFLKRHWSGIALGLVIVIGVCLLAYPTVSDWYNSIHQSRAISNYMERVEQLDETDYSALLQAAQEYNEYLTGKENPLVVEEEERARYEALLNVAGNGIMGYVDIPRIHVELPIYHGTSDAVLQVAVGHMEGSSLPVGGSFTHAVLSGHTGLPKAVLFTNLTELKEDDIFIISVLNETLTYQIDQIKIVLPQETEDLQIVPGQDYCTLITCTPYGVNSHRLLVRGHRIENLPVEEVEEIKPVIAVASAPKERNLPLLIGGGASVLILFLALVIKKTRNRAKKKRKKG